MKIPYVFKKCSKCGEWKVATTEYFYRKKGSKYGISSWCKKCYQSHCTKYYKTNKEKQLERSKKYNKEHKERIKEYDKKYRKDHKEERKEYNRNYYKENIDKYRYSCKQYYEKNKDKWLEYNKKYMKSEKGQVAAFNGQQRYRLKAQNQGNGITTEQWKEMMDFFGWRCAYSGITLLKKNRSIDHIVPISKGGENEIWNIVPMYKNYNKSKNAQDMMEWYTKQEFYSEERLNKIKEWQEYAYNKYGLNDEII